MSELRWIPVTERLPEEGEPVAVYMPDWTATGFGSVGLAQFTGGEFRSVTTSMSQPTYWLPLWPLPDPHRRLYERRPRP